MDGVGLKAGEDPSIPFTFEFVGEGVLEGTRLIISPASDPENAGVSVMIGGCVALAGASVGDSVAASVFVRVIAPVVERLEVIGLNVAENDDIFVSV